jgi:uncharacterized protein YjdB
MTRTINLPITNTYQSRPIFFDQYGRPTTTSTSIVYSTTDSTIGTVDSVSGLVTAIADGTVTITATSGTLTSSININVYTPIPSTLSLN